MVTYDKQAKSTYHADSHKNNNVAEPDESVAHNRHDPVDMVLGRPAIDEETGGQENGTDGKNLQPILGSTLPLAVWADFGLHDAVTSDAEENEAQEGTDAHADEDQADNLGAYSVTRYQHSGGISRGSCLPHTKVIGIRVSKHPRDCGEHEVHVPIHDSNINRKNDANRAQHQHLQRPHNAALEVILWAQPDIQLTPQQLITRLLPQPVDPPLQQNGSVRLPSKHEHAKCHHARQDRQDPKDPAPAQTRVADDATDDGRDDGPQKHAHGHERHGVRPLLLRDHVGNRPAAVGNRARTKDARQEAESNQRVETWRLGTRNEKRNKTHVAHVVNDQPSIDLAQRSDHQGPRSETEDVHRYHEGGQFRGGVVEFFHHGGHAGGKDRRGQRGDEGLRADETHVEDLLPARPVVGVLGVVFVPPDYVGVVFL